MTNTTSATGPSMLLCRLAAAILAILALGLLALGVVCLPPVLESFVLADRTVGGALRQAAFYALTVSCLVIAVTLALGARRLERRRMEIPARRVRNAWIAALVATTLACGAAELAVRSTKTLDEVLSGDDFWIHRWLARRELKPAGPEAEYPMDSNDGLHRYDAQLGWVAVEDYRSEKVNTNSRGLRGTAEVPLQKPAGEKRIVVIGDSFTFGVGVHDGEVWTARMEQQLRGSRVANLGGLGYGTDQQFLRLESEGWRYSPDVVVVGFFGPDADRNVLRFRDYAKPMFTVRGDTLQGTWSIPDPKEAHWSDPVPFSYAWTWLVTRARALVDRTRLAPKWKVTCALLDAIERTTRAHGARLLLVHFPSKAGAFRADAEGSEAILAEWAEERGVPFESLRTTFARLSPEERARVFSNHWTPFGNEVVGLAVAGRVAGL